jgi:hypothetical protein
VHVMRGPEAGMGEVVMVARGMTPAHRLLRSRVVATVVLDVVASALVFVFERHAPGTEISVVAILAGSFGAFFGHVHRP